MADPATFGGRPFADVLRRHRLVVGLTQEELAEAAGLSVRGLRYLERGLRHPTRDTVGRLVAALDLSPADGRGLARAARPGPDGSALPPRRGAPPVPPGALIGRERELAAVVDVLSGGDVRILTLTGPGGVGKTRLAQETARRLDAGFSDGAVWVPVATLADPALLPAAVAGALGLATDGPGDVEVVAGALAGRRLLLVLDDFERIAAAA